MLELALLATTLTLASGQVELLLNLNSKLFLVEIKWVGEGE